MLKKLQKHWGVDGWDFILIFCAFGVTGTVTAWVGKEITSWLDTDKYSTAWWALKILVFVVGYQVFLLFFGLLFGQFAFFWKFEKKLLSRFGLFKTDKPFTIVIFASGAGSNAKRIIETFRKDPSVRIPLIVCNKKKAGVLDIARENGIKVYHTDKEDIDGKRLMAELEKVKTDLIVLAGYLWKLPAALTSQYTKKIINIHPALLPKYGGKGMYGHHVHEAVIAAGEKESGITIHYVDEVYDNGEIIFQKSTAITPDETPASLAAKIHQLEHEYFPKIIAQEIEKRNQR